MCGIAGLVWREQPGVRLPLGERAVRAMMAAMGHRGPDASGLELRRRAVLGHVRLSVIDIEGSAQPMAGANGTVWLSYNGEIYNFPQLRAAAAARGWHFNTRGDSETVLATFAQRGPSFDEALNGMYAYALLDERDGEGAVLLGTDPLGIKPLFLYEDEELALFASELRGIAAGLGALGKRATPSRKAVEGYLRNGWIPAPMAALEGARRLEPGERWTIEPGCKAVLHSRRTPPMQELREWRVAEVDEQLQSLLGSAMQRQMVSDVPLGFFLSGGIDSSLCLALAAKMGCDTTSFTVRFTGAGHGVAAADESEIARAVAQRLGSRHHELAIDAGDLTGSLDGVFAAMDQPLADPACLPLFHLARMACEHATVCISGDGGDELFGGYPRHRLVQWQSGWGALPQRFRNLACSAAALLPEAPSSGPREILRKARVGHRLIDSGHYIEPLFDAVGEPSPWHDTIPPCARQMMQIDLSGQLAGQMLAKTDAMTMVHGLECRVPLLDLELVEFAASLPLGQKRHGRTGKLPLRRALAKNLPPEFTALPKRGFRVPMTSWFSGELAGQVRDRLLGANALVGEYLPREIVAQTVEAHLSGRREMSRQIWALLALESWLARTSGGRA